MISNSKAEKSRAALFSGTQKMKLSVDKSKLDILNKAELGKSLP